MRPLYQSEPREQLEERLRAVAAILTKACYIADEEDSCGCATCHFLRGVLAEIDAAAAIDLDVGDGMAPEPVPGESPDPDWMNP